jgi:rhamnulokinase
MTDRRGRYAAVDLGASSGRVMVAEVGPDRLDLRERHRFENRPVRVPDGLHWDILRLHRDVLDGLRLAAEDAAGEPVTSVGVDSWGVDHGLLDATGALVGNPYHYRDSRTEGVPDKVHALIPARRLYEITGLQVLPFNTVYQLAAAAGGPALDVARTLLLVPDLIAYWLTGTVGAEVTNASTTGLLDARTGRWSAEILDAVGISAGLLPPLRRPGDVLGPLTTAGRAETGLCDTVLTAVGSHDTASAVVGVPGEGDRWAYICSGTWSLVGVELDRPVLTEDSRAANFTNEGGVDGRVRYLRNVMGLWVLQEAMATWRRAGQPHDLRALLGAAAEVAPGGPVVDIDDPAFLPPGDMPARIADACRRTGQPEPSSQPAMVRCILDSLADAYARTLRDAARLSGRQVDRVHLVGGPARNELLCQLTADACGVPVLAGPVEAAALGNVLVQARAHGTVTGDLDTLRALIRRTHDLRRYEPGPG